MTAILTAHPGEAADLRALLVGMAPLCRAEPDNLRRDVWRDLAHGERYVLDELYLDAAAVEAHRKTPALSGLFGQDPRTGRPNGVGVEALKVRQPASIAHSWLPVEHTHASPSGQLLG